MFQTKVVEKIKTHILQSVTFFFSKIVPFEIIWKKYSTASQATEDNIIRRMSVACWITTSTKNTQNMQYLLHFHGNNGYANAPECYIIRTLRILQYVTKMNTSLPASYRGGPRSIPSSVYVRYVVD